MRFINSREFEIYDHLNEFRHSNILTKFEIQILSFSIRIWKMDVKFSLLIVFAVGFSMYWYASRKLNKLEEQRKEEQSESEDETDSDLWYFLPDSLCPIDR